MTRTDTQHPEFFSSVRLTDRRLAAMRLIMAWRPR
jgi:hypothetical protein